MFDSSAKLLWVIGIGLWFAVSLYRGWQQRGHYGQTETVRDREPRLKVMISGLRQNARTLVIALISFLLLNLVFYTIILIGIQQGWVGQNPSLAVLEPINWICIGCAILAQALDELKRSQPMNQILRWLIISLCVLGYFTYTLWVINSAE